MVKIQGMGFQLAGIGSASSRSSIIGAKGKGRRDFPQRPLFNAGNDQLSHTLRVR